MNILLSGATGFVGSNLIKYLEGLSIRKISRDDLMDTNAGLFENAEVIIHLAGKAHDLKKVSDSKEYYAVNYEITKKLYDQFLVSKAKKFIFISSVKAVADTITGELDEDVVPNPLTHYGKSKLMAEEYIRSHDLPLGKSFYILRPCMIHGPGNKGNLNLLYQLVKKKIPYPLASFKNKRSFLSVENLCFVISELILRRDISSGVYNIADNEALSTNDVVKILAKSLNNKVRLWHLAPSIIKLIAKLGDAIHLPLSTERLNKLTESYIVSNAKLVTALGKSLPVTARDGLHVTSNSFKQS